MCNVYIVWHTRPSVYGFSYILQCSSRNQLKGFAIKPFDFYTNIMCAEALQQSLPASFRLRYPNGSLHTSVRQVLAVYFIPTTFHVRSSRPLVGGAFRTLEPYSKIRFWRNDGRWGLVIGEGGG